MAARRHRERPALLGWKSRTRRHWLPVVVSSRQQPSCWGWGGVIIGQGIWAQLNRPGFQVAVARPGSATGRRCAGSGGRGGGGAPQFQPQLSRVYPQRPQLPPRDWEVLGSQRTQFCKDHTRAFAKGSGLRGVGGISLATWGSKLLPPGGGGAGAGQSTHLGQPGVHTVGRQWFHVTARQIPAGPTGSPEQDP